MTNKTNRERLRAVCQDYFGIINGRIITDKFLDTILVSIKVCPECYGDRIIGYEDDDVEDESNIRECPSCHGDGFILIDNKEKK